MKNISLREALEKGTIIKAVRFDSFWPDFEEPEQGEDVTLVLSHTINLVANGPLHHGSYHTGYVFTSKYGDVTLCELHSWGSSEDSRYGDVFSNCGFRIVDAEA